MGTFDKISVRIWPDFIFYISCLSIVIFSVIMIKALYVVVLFFLNTYCCIFTLQRKYLLLGFSKI
ncbi:MAG: hypothetical protein CVU52_05595 [Deltaproteobacteria bacterium HGW-Deltaproteobacteria-10]|nr:MAG: hypothetical protein CVU52_05595 [Deltaproteobacteria bacterium HGW-Deltaproteobacteria-10]